MPTNKTRLNISLPDSVRYALIRLARQERIPQATKAARLLEIALELEEDGVWDSLAQKRDTKKAVYLPHDKVWK